MLFIVIYKKFSLCTHASVRILVYGSTFVCVCVWSHKNSLVFSYFVHVCECVVLTLLFLLVLQLLFFKKRKNVRELEDQKRLRSWLIGVIPYLLVRSFDQRTSDTILVPRILQEALTMILTGFNVWVGLWFQRVPISYRNWWQCM